uniref:DUF2971 domain-containing protein n=1 Tax=Siphoviridae sp. ctREU2 TaxID=2826333 RepID=A0A8S5NIQ7_9CAUD|nr:MAG TPA: Protein of unknown function (DUF2971) [Siphoviridae sp. ctREU2]
MIYQYTNLDALLGILKRESKNICLWATRYNCLNDPNEISFGINTIKKLLTKYKERYSRDLFNGSITPFDDFASIVCCPFIISFSKKKDFLPMWNTYGSRGNGVSLGFDRDIIYKNKNNWMLNDCGYYDETKEADEHVLQNILPKYEQKYGQDVVNGYLNLVAELCSIIKNPYYEYEEEVRLFNFSQSTYNKQPIFFNPILEENIKFRTRNNEIIPYTEFYLPKQSLKEIYLGPSLDKEFSEEKIRYYLEICGFGDVTIIQSNAPYRC